MSVNIFVLNVQNIQQNEITAPRVIPPPPWLRRQTAVAVPCHVLKQDFYVPSFLYLSRYLDRCCHQTSDVVPCHVLKQTCMLQVFYVQTICINKNTSSKVGVNNSRYIYIDRHICTHEITIDTDAFFCWYLYIFIYRYLDIAMLAVLEDLEQHAEPSIIHPRHHQKNDVVPCHVLKQTCMFQAFFVDTNNMYLSISI